MTTTSWPRARSADPKPMKGSTSPSVPMLARTTLMEGMFSRTRGERKRKALGLTTGRVRSARQPVDRGIGPTAGERSLGLGLAEELEEQAVDRVTDVEAAIVVRVSRVEAGGSFVCKEEVLEKADHVGNVDHSVRIYIAAA